MPGSGWRPSGPTVVPHAWRHFGSIHAGRYANYALFIDTENRIPFLAQNMGQSLLAAFGLPLGITGPLAALMVWIPFSLAALALMLYGTLRAGGLTRAWSGAGSFFVLLCNIGLDRRALFVFDSGSPLGFIGNADLVLSIGTFLVLASWLESGAASGRPLRRLLPGVLGLTWCWYAPQNVALAIPVLVVALWLRGSPGKAAGERPAAIWPAAVAGLLLLALALRRTRATLAGQRFWIALATFGSGFGITFLFEYGGMKWWLTRFLVPGTALCLLWGFEALAAGLSHLTARLRSSLLAALLVAATYGPLAELAWLCRENLVRTQAVDPIGRRVELLVTLRVFFPDARPLAAKGSPEPWQ